jgi:hypothetical protein
LILDGGNMNKVCVSAEAERLVVTDLGVFSVDKHG